jgi:malonyl-CoA/methylmalonyl-CoA synthetase
MTSWAYEADASITNLPQLIKSRIRSFAPFISDGDGRKLTYGDYWELAGMLANALAAHGVTRGARVAVQVEKSVEALALFLACARRGAVFLPLNTAYTVAELAYFIGDAEPSLIVCSPAQEAALADLARGRALLTLDGDGKGSLTAAAARASPTFKDVLSNWDDLAAILYTSGTTGRSKGAMLSHGNLASNALSLVEAWRFTEQDVLLHALPIYHTHGLFTASNTMLLSGGQMIFRRKFDANDVIERLPQATTMMGVPTFYTRLLQHEELTRDLVRHMRLFVSGSAPLLAETHREFFARTGHAILERYGMTETNMNTSNPYDGERRAGTVGFPLPRVELRITDPATGRPLPQGETGMIEVRGPNVFKGYWRMPEKTADEFRGDGFFITGDLGTIDTQGYVSIVGRGKDLIITGGFNVYPKEIENEIDALPGIVESAVIGVPHPDFGEGVTAVVVVKGNDMRAVSEREVIAALEPRLAKFKLPKRVIFVPDLPRNAMGKVQKRELRETYAALYS